MKTSTLLVLAFVAYLVVNAAQKSVTKVADAKSGTINRAIQGGVDLGTSVINALLGRGHASSAGVAHNTGDGVKVDSSGGHTIDYGGGELDDADPISDSDPDELLVPGLGD